MPQSFPRVESCTMLSEDLARDVSQTAESISRTLHKFGSAGNWYTGLKKCQYHIAVYERSLTITLSYLECGTIDSIKILVRATTIVAIINE